MEYTSLDPAMAKCRPYFGSIRCSNLYTKIVEYSAPDQMAVCNLISIAVNIFMQPDETYDFEKLKHVAKIATMNLNKIFHVNCYPAMETYTRNFYAKRILSGEFQVITQHLLEDLTEWSSEVKKEVIGCIQVVDCNPDNNKLFSKAESKQMKKLRSGMTELSTNQRYVTPSDGWKGDFYLPMGWSVNCGFLQPEISLEINQDPAAGLITKTEMRTKNHTRAVLYLDHGSFLNSVTLELAKQSCEKVKDMVCKLVNSKVLSSVELTDFKSFNKAEKLNHPDAVMENVINETKTAMDDETTYEPNKSRELFESSQSFTMGNLAPEGWKDDETLPHGWKTISQIPNIKTKPVDCNLCDQVSEWRIPLSLHIEGNHEGIGYPCNLCEDELMKKPNLEGHSRKKHAGLMLTCDRCDSFITRELLFKLHIQEKHTDEFDSTNTDEEIYTNVETGEETAEKLLDDVENEAPGRTIAFIAGKSSMVGQPRGIRSALAKMEWHEMCEPDDHAEYFEDNDDENVGVPDDMPAVPDVQMLQASPLYALPAYRECGPGNSYASNYGLITEPMLNFPRIQADEYEDQEDVFTAVQNLAVDKDLEMNALNPGKTPWRVSTCHGSPSLGSNLRLTRLTRKKRMKIYQNVYNSSEVEDFKNLKIVVKCLNYFRK
jgi:hypothetical protein